MRFHHAVLLISLVSFTRVKPENLAIGLKEEALDLRPATWRCNEGLNFAAQGYGKYIGYAASAQEFDDDSFRRIASNCADFGQLTPSYGMKWASLQPAPGVFDFVQADVVADIARVNGQLLRCHALVWHLDLPGWIANGSWDRQRLIDVLWTHITTVVSRYRGVCYSWDVVNEALLDEGSFRDSIFLKVIGPEYITIAFQAAAYADPYAKLYYNDYNIDNYWGAAPPVPSDHSQQTRNRRDPPWEQPWNVQSQTKIDSAKRLVNMVRSGGGKIDGMGLQGHYVYDNVPSTDTLRRILNEFANMNLDVAITELDIRMNFGNINDYTAQMQVDGYVNVMAACRDVYRCVGVTLWGFTDRTSWVTDTFPEYGSALPWDYNLQPKYAVYHGIMRSFPCNHA